MAVTLVMVSGFSWYALRQLQSLEELQTNTIDRNRRSSLQLLRIQGDLHSLGLAMRDMLDAEEPYPLTAWSAQFARIRTDLEDALRLEREASRIHSQSAPVEEPLRQFWTSTEQMFDLARKGDDPRARELLRSSLQAQQASLTNAVARMLADNANVEEAAAGEARAIHQRIKRNIYYFCGAVLLAIAITGLYMVHSNRKVFERMALLSEQRSDLAKKLINVQEEVLRSVARELHDEFGQVLTAIGALLQRVERKHGAAAPELMADLAEVRDIAQSTLEKTRSLSQALHPSILDDAGLEKAIEWYIAVFTKQTGIMVSYEKTGASPEIPQRVAVNVYRVLQEALHNAARHSKSPSVAVKLHFAPERLTLLVQDKGVGFREDGRGGGHRGIGLTAMKERADLLHGKLEISKPAEGGASVRLEAPLQEDAPLRQHIHDET